MTQPAPPEPLPEAAALLEQAARLVKPSAELLYTLAVAYKRQGKLAEARDALRRIAGPDAGVLLQMGVLSHAAGDPAAAAAEFARALEADPGSYAAAYNLLVVRLQLGEPEKALELLPRARQAAPAEEARLLGLFESLLRGALPPHADAADGGAPVDPGLAAIRPPDEARLLELLRGLGRFEVAHPVLRNLAAARPDSPLIQRAYVEQVLLRGKWHADRCEWSAADAVLAPLAPALEKGAHPAGHVPDPVRAAYLNLHGVCACMLQSYAAGIRSFAVALRLTGNDPWLHQNLALAHEWLGRWEQAELHWGRYFDLLGEGTPAPAAPGYTEALACAGLFRLADVFSRQEKWNSCLTYVQRAAKLRPRDMDTLDRLYQLYLQLRRPEDARRVLRKMRELRPADPQFDLYELDLEEVRTVDDIDRVLGQIKTVLHRHPGDAQVEERAMGMINNFLPRISKECDRLANRLGHITDQLRKLPSYQINWPVVHDEMRQLRQDFQKLRKLGSKCLSLASTEEQRRSIRELNEHIDRKLDQCRSLER